MVVIGGGVVACESVTWLHGLGSEQLTVVEGSQRLLGRTEPFAGELVAQQFGKVGIDVRLGARAASVRREGPRDTGEGHVHGGEVTLTLEDGTSVTADEIVVAAGRTPNSDDLGLDTVGVAANEHGYLDVDDHLTVTGSQWLYAVGDLCGRALLTHMGKYQGRIAADVILGKDARIVSDGLLSPRVIFTDPQVAAVGHTLASAEEAGLKVRAVDVPTSSNAGASFVGRNAPGTSRLVVDEGGVIVGATFTGVEVAESLHAATIAVTCELRLEQLVHAVACFPTRSELWLKLLEADGL